MIGSHPYDVKGLDRYSRDSKVPPARRGTFDRVKEFWRHKRKVVFAQERLKGMNIEHRTPNIE